MTSAAPTRVLVVAHRTAATPRLLAQVRARARRSPCSFTLLVPRPYWDPQTEEAATTLELALPLLDEAPTRAQSTALTIGVGDRHPVTAAALDARRARPDDPPRDRHTWPDMLASGATVIHALMARGA
jgi:hypothetical protein